METTPQIFKDLTPSPEAIYDSYDNYWKCPLQDKKGNIVQIGYGKSKEQAEQAARLIAASDDILHALSSFLSSMHGVEQFPGHNKAYRVQVVLPRALKAFEKAGPQGYTYR